MSSSSFTPTIVKVLRGRSFRETIYGKVRYGQAHIEMQPGIIEEHPVVIKEYERALVDARRTRNGDPVGEDAREELRLHAMMSERGHDNVVKLWDVRKDNTHYFAILEYCGRGEFFPLVQQDAFTPLHSRFYFSQLIKGLAFMHKCGVCHRDLSLENILLDDRSVLKICDFGVAVSWRPSDGLIKDEGVPVGKCVHKHTRIRMEDGTDKTAEELWEIKEKGAALPRIMASDGGGCSVVNMDRGETSVYYEVACPPYQPYKVTHGHYIAMTFNDHKRVFNRVFLDAASGVLLLLTMESATLSVRRLTARATVTRQDSENMQNADIQLMDNDMLSFLSSIAPYILDESLGSFPTLSSAISALRADRPAALASGQPFQIPVEQLIHFPYSLRSFLSPQLVSSKSSPSPASPSPPFSIVRHEGAFPWVGFSVSAGDRAFVLADGLVTGNCRFYMSPEVFARQYYSPALYDVWCCGIILFVMLTKVHPFKFATPSDQRFLMVYNGQINELLAKWSKEPLPPVELDLLTRMLAPPDRRISVEEILEHPYVKELGEVEVSD